MKGTECHHRAPGCLRHSLEKLDLKSQVQSFFCALLKMLSALKNEGRQKARLPTLSLFDSFRHERIETSSLVRGEGLQCTSPSPKGQPGSASNITFTLSRFLAGANQHDQTSHGPAEGWSVAKSSPSAQQEGLWVAAQEGLLRTSSSLGTLRQDPQLWQDGLSSGDWLRLKTD